MKQFVKYCTITLLLLLTLHCSKWDLARKTILSITMEPVENIKITSLVLNATMAGLADGDEVTDHGFVWSNTNMNPSFNDAIKSLGPRKNNGDFSFQLSNLPVASNLYVRAYAEFNQTIIFTDPLQITLPSSQVKVHMDSIIKLRDHVKLVGSIKDLEPGVQITSYGHVWSSVNKTPSIENDQVNYFGKLQTAELKFESQVTDLIPLVPYYARSFMLVGNAIKYSENTLSFSKGDAWISLEKAIVTGVFHRSFQYQGEVYLTRGPLISKFNPSNYNFENLTNIPGIDVNSLSFPVAFLIDGKIYITTGITTFTPKLTASRATWIYDIEANIWSTGAPYPDDRYNATGFTINGIGYAGFGQSGENTRLVYDFWAYNPNTDQWTAVASFPEDTKRTSPELAVFDFADRVCVGLSRGEPGDDFWCFRGGNSSWEPIANFPVQVSSLFDDPKYFTIGNKGYIYIHDTRNNFYEYDLKSDTWTLRADFPGGARTSTLAFAYKNRGYLGNGLDVITGDLQLKFWQYIPISDEE